MGRATGDGSRAASQDPATPAEAARSDPFSCARPARREGGDGDRGEGERGRWVVKARPARAPGAPSSFQGAQGARIRSRGASGAEGAWKRTLVDGPVPVVGVESGVHVSDVQVDGGVGVDVRGGVVAGDGGERRGGVAVEAAGGLVLGLVVAAKRHGEGRGGEGEGEDADHGQRRSEACGNIWRRGNRERLNRDGRRSTSCTRRRA